MRGRERKVIEPPNGRPTVLFRYMDREHCERMVNGGVVRLTKSSIYEDGTGMTELQMGDEHFKSLEFESSGVSEVVDKTGGIDITPELVRLAESPAGAAYRISAKVKCPYWMFCLSTDLRLNLFEARDFRCNAAVIVWDAEELFRRIASAAALCVQPHGGKALWQPVSYAASDSLYYGMTAAAISPFFTKPDRYLHQKEFRFVIYPCYDARDHTFIYLDSLEDICEVVGKEELVRGDIDEVVWDEKAFGAAAQQALLNSEHTLVAKVRGRKVRDIVRGEDGGAWVTEEKTYSNTVPRVLLDYLTEAPHGLRLPLDEIDLESFHTAEQISKRPVYLPKDD